MKKEIKRLVGGKEYKAFLAGEKLTRKEAMEAMCYVCNEHHEGRDKDCMGESCPLYAWFPYRGERGRNGPEITLQDAPDAHHKTREPHLIRERDSKTGGCLKNSNKSIKQEASFRKTAI